MFGVNSCRSVAVVTVLVVMVVTNIGACVGSKVAVN